MAEIDNMVAMLKLVHDEIAELNRALTGGADSHTTEYNEGMDAKVADIGSNVSKVSILIEDIETLLKKSADSTAETSEFLVRAVADINERLDRVYARSRLSVWCWLITAASMIGILATLRNWF